MPLYQLHTPLHTKHGLLPKGSVSTLKMLKPDALVTLLRMGYISEAETPPLDVLPGYELVGAKLAAYDVVTVADFIIMLEDAPDDLSRILQTDVATLQTWRHTLEINWLSVPLKSG